MAISKVPRCPSRIETPNKIFLKTYRQSCSLPLNAMLYYHCGKMAYSKTRNDRNTKFGTVKPGYGILNSGQTVSSASLTRINQNQLTALPIQLGILHFLITNVLQQQLLNFFTWSSNQLLNLNIFSFLRLFYLST